MEYTAKETLDLLREVAKGKEDFVYTTPEVPFDDPGTGETRLAPSPTCLYTNPDGSAGCIVGHVLQRILPGEEFKALHEREFPCEPGFHFGSGVTATELPEVSENFCPDSVALLGLVQVKQDAGESWGDAILGAIDVWGISRGALAGMNIFNSHNVDKAIENLREDIDDLNQMDLVEDLEELLKFREEHISESGVDSWMNRLNFLSVHYPEIFDKVKEHEGWSYGNW